MTFCKKYELSYQRVQWSHDTPHVHQMHALQVFKFILKLILVCFDKCSPQKKN